MKHPELPTPFLYVDDGFPESREYADNYVAIDPEPPRSWLRILLGGGRRTPARKRPPQQLLRPDERTPIPA